MESRVEGVQVKKATETAVLSAIRFLLCNLHASHALDQPNRGFLKLDMPRIDPQPYCLGYRSNCKDTLYSPAIRLHSHNNDLCRARDLAVGQQDLMLIGLGESYHGPEMFVDCTVLYALRPSLQASQPLQHHIQSLLSIRWFAGDFWLTA